MADETDFKSLIADLRKRMEEATEQLKKLEKLEKNIRKKY